jgi:glycosyltransferase involved in cell wall biosynthesis
LVAEQHRFDCVVLYDVDPVNPYGRELGAVLKHIVPSVTLVCSAAVTWAPEGITVTRALAAPRTASNAASVAWRRLTGVLHLGPLVMRRHSVVVVVWSRDFWDALCLAALARVTRRVVVVDHNPSGDRRHRGLKGRAERALRRTARVVVVHDAALVAAEESDAVKTRVAPHPAYLEWRQRFLPHQPAPASGRVLFVGALRTDKGLAEMPAVLSQLPAGTQLRIVGPGQVPDAWLQAAGSRQISVEHVGDGRFVDDDELAAAVADGGVVVAPYVGATQSGTVALAVTIGLPVLAYDVGALRSLLADDALVPAGRPDALAAAVTLFFAKPWPTSRATPDEMSAASADGWRRLLSGLG